MNDTDTILRTSPTYVRIVTVVNGVFCLVGGAISIYVYWHFPHPTVVLHIGNAARSEYIETYIFEFQVAQTVIFIAFAYQTLFWKRTLQHAAERETWLKNNVPSLRPRPLHSVTLPKVVTTGFIVVGVVLFALTIYRSILVATGAV
jgi:hypothetical protein